MTLNEQILKFADLISKSNYIVFFGGAGTSTDSGIKDFRGKNGLYKTLYKDKYQPEEILSIDFFLKNRKIFNEYVENVLSIENISPNKGHYSLVFLEKIGKLKYIITQNIDNLHQEAGIRNVLELHGTLKDWFCLSCGKHYTKNTNCDCNGIVRPRVTLYGEELDQNIVKKAINEIQKADLLIIAGTSLTVYPAAYYIRYFRGNNLVIINDSPTQYDNDAELVIKNNFEDTMVKLIEHLKTKN